MKETLRAIQIAPFILRLPFFSCVFAFLSLALLISCSSPRPVPTPTPTTTPMPSLPPIPPSSPTSSAIPNADAAIALIKTQFTEVANINKIPAGSIGASQNIFAFERADGWDIAFWQGDGDCPAGCINNRYWYFSVKKDGRVERVGAYSKIFDAQKNAFDISGTPMWGVPK